MKLIVWWITLMLILPLAYLFWWKKRWRLLLGVIILAVLVISYLVPGEFAFSKLTNEIEKRQSPVKQLKEALENISDDEPNPSDSEKTKCEKLIIKLGKEIQKFAEKKWKGEKLNEMEEKTKFWLEVQLYGARIEWVKKWGKKEKSPTFLFCGEQFNEGLDRKREHEGEKWQRIGSDNIIDFGQSENNKKEILKKKLEEIHEKNEEDVSKGDYPTVWLKNIDKITNPELKKELVKIVDPDQKNNLGKYYKETEENGKPKKVEKTVDLSLFTLVVTTSAAHPELPNELRTKLKHIEPFLEKYKWVIFFSSTGVEIVVFVLLIRSRRKSKDKSLKHLEYY